MSITLCWHEHQSNLARLLQNFRVRDSLVDCTLAAEGKFLKAHKVVLSACSPYFQMIFNLETDKNPIVILKDVPYECLKCVLDYVYLGEVQVPESQLSTFLEVARSLQIQRLDSKNKEPVQERQHSSQSKTKECDTRSMACGASEDVIDVDNYRSVVQVGDGSSMASIPEVSLEANSSEAQDAQAITIENTYSMAPDNRVVPGLVGSANHEILEWIRSSEPPSVSSTPDAADEVVVIDLNPDPGSSGTADGENNASDTLHRESRKQSNSSGSSGTAEGENNASDTLQRESRKQSNFSGSSGTAEGENNASDTLQRESRKQSNFSVPCKRRVLGGSVSEEKSRLQPPGRRVAKLHKRVTFSETVQASPNEELESSQEAESALLKTGDSLNSLSVTLCRTEIPHTPVGPSKKLLPEPSKETCTEKTQRPTPKHKRYHMRHTCPDCHKQFMTPSSLALHRRAHTGEHRHLHTGERPFQCKICDKTFKRADTLKIHLRSHTGVRPYKCQHCDKSFTEPSHLGSHKRVHMEGNFKCDACGKSFNREPLLEKHWFLVHEVPH